MSFCSVPNIAIFISISADYGEILSIIGQY